MTVLEHEILKTLRRGGLTVMSQGSEKEGHILINKTLLGHCSLHYGTLIALLNQPDLKPPQGNIVLEQWVVKKEEINFYLYDLETVEKSIQILILNRHIIDSAEKEWIYIDNRQIQLTKSGLLALVTKYYIKEKQKENQSEDTRLIAWASLGVAASSAIISFLQFIKPNEVTVPQLDKLLPEIQKLQKSPQTIQKERTLTPFHQRDSSINKKDASR